MRVLVIPSWYPSKEAPTAGIFIYQQVHAIRCEADVAVLFVSESRSGQALQLSTEDDVPIARIALKSPPTAISFAGRLKAVARNLHNRFIAYPRAGLLAFSALASSWGPPDIIHVQALFPAALIADAIRRRYGIPYVVTEHSEEYLAASERRLTRLPGVVRLLLRPLARHASRTIAVSSFLAARLTQLGLAVDPVVIPNVVPSSEYCSRQESKPTVFAHVSVMGPAKNLPALLEAVDHVRRNRTDFLLRLIGDGECRANLEAIVAARGIGHYVEFAGQKSAAEVRRLLGAASFTVISSTHETFSVSAAESLMLGRPVLSTRCGGPEEFITPAVGHLIEGTDGAALAGGIEWMLEHAAEYDPAALHAYANARFAPAVVAARIVDVYATALGTRTPK